MLLLSRLIPPQVFNRGLHLDKRGAPAVKKSVEIWVAHSETKNTSPALRFAPMYVTCGQLPFLAGNDSPRDRGMVILGQRVRQTAVVGSEKRLTKCFRALFIVASE